MNRGNRKGEMADGVEGLVDGVRLGWLGVLHNPGRGDGKLDNDNDTYGKHAAISQ